MLVQVPEARALFDHVHAFGQVLLFSAFSLSCSDIFGEGAPVGQGSAAALPSLAIALLQEAQELRLGPEHK